MQRTSHTHFRRTYCKDIIEDTYKKETGNDWHEIKLISKFNMDQKVKSWLVHEE
jgi:hypothetical protein